MNIITDRLILFWLGCSGAGTKKLNALLEIYEPLEVWESIDSGSLDKPLGETTAAALKKTKNVKKLEEALDGLYKKDIVVVTRADSEYPERLNQKEVNPPLFLYCMGNVNLLKSNCIAVVGTRTCSRYGKEACEMITRDLAAGGLTIVSGLATGIDTYAHIETLNSGGKTIAVLGAGFDHIYPTLNEPLSQRILKTGGLLVCEYPPKTEPTRYNFPERNRIISGLSAGVLIVEAGMPSGTLITAECALEQGREVFAVPGNITSPKSKGTNELLVRGHAKITTSAEQIFEELKLINPNIKKNTVIELDFLEQRIYNLLENEPRPFDELMLLSEMSASELTAILTGLELKGAIKRLPSNFYAAVFQR